MIPVVLRSHGDTDVVISRADKLAPADDLSQETFQRVEWHVVLTGEFLCFIDDLLGREQSGIERRRQHAVPQP